MPSNSIKLHILHLSQNVFDCSETISESWLCIKNACNLPGDFSYPRSVTEALRVTSSTRLVHVQVKLENSFPANADVFNNIPCK